jgi:2,5-dihydroxypyridine 5,6-dioxygenase
MFLLSANEARYRLRRMAHTPYAGGPFSYFDTPTVAPFGIVELMPGARNLMEYAGVRAGEKVLILTEHTVDPVVLQALGAAAAYRGANVHLLSVEPFSPGGADRENPGPASIAAAAHGDADVVISCTWWAEVHCEPLFFSQVAQKRKRFVSLHMAATAACLNTGARLPPEVYYALMRRAAELMGSGAEIHLSTRQGTDLTFGGIELTPDDGALVPGGWRPFPYGGVNFYPSDCNGVFVVEDSTATGVPEEPLVVTMEDNRVAKIEGGAAAEQLRRFGPRGYYMRHAFLGVNPKVRLSGASQFEREKHAGAFYFGIDGLTDAHEVDPTQPGYAHCDCQFDRPTVRVGDTVLSQDGRLLILDEPEIRSVASRYGPPEIVLDDNPQLILPRRFSGAFMECA